MCGFTCITYTECGHTALSTKPEHTSLCHRAKMICLVQGVDCAPADCVPTNDTETHIAANHVIFDLCDDCRTIERAANAIERGEMDDIVQAYAHVKEEDQGFYDEDETEQLHNLAVYLDGKHTAGLAVTQQLRALASNPSTLALVADPELCNLLCAQDVDKHFATFKHCSELFPLMAVYIQQRAPNKLFVETFIFLRDKAKRATTLLECFQVVVDCLLNFESSRPEEHFNGSETRLEFFGNMLKYMITGTGLDVPPLGFHFQEDSFEIPEATIEQMEAKQNLRQSSADTPVKRSSLKPSRKERGVLNIHGLEFDSESLKGLLDDEPSRDFEAVHVAIPEDEIAKGVDVDGGQGNKLVWRDGKSHIIFAATESKDASTTKESVEQSAELMDEPQAGSTQDFKPREGFGFDYSDYEDGSDAGAEGNEANVVMDDTTLMAAPGDQSTNCEGHNLHHEHYEGNESTVSENDGDPSAKRTEGSNHVSSDPSPYLYIPSSPPMSIAGGSHHSYSPGTSSPSSPLLPTLPNEMPRAEPTPINSSSSSPLSRKRKVLSSEVHKKERSINSDEEESEEEYFDPPVKRKCRKFPSSGTSSSRSTTPILPPSAELPPLPPSSASSSRSSSSSASPSRIPPAPLPPQPAPVQQRRQARAMSRGAVAAPASPSSSPALTRKQTSPRESVEREGSV